MFLWSKKILRVTKNLNRRNIIRYVLSFKHFVNNCFIDINNIKKLPNVFSRKISEIIMTNLKEHAGCLRVEGVTKFGNDGGKGGVKNLTF